MLNEIFKGMDNAAELINENFLKNDIKIETTETGYKATLGNIVILWGEHKFDKGTGWIVGDVHTFNHEELVIPSGIKDTKSFFTPRSYNGTSGFSSYEIVVTQITSTVVNFRIKAAAGGPFPANVYVSYFTIGVKDN